ncbi:MAG: CvpA family protein [Pseudomonadota bacterium]
MTLLDFMVLGVLLLTVVRGLMRGLVDTLFSLAAWVLAFVAGKWGAWFVVPLLPIDAGQGSVAYFVGFLTIFLAVLIGTLLLGHTVGALVKAVGLGSADKVLGGAFGLAKGAVILIGLTLLAGLTSLPRTEFWKQALLSGSLQAMAERALPLIPADVARHVRFE